MTRDEIIKLARECADNCDGYGFAVYTRSLERLAALVSAKEREACAKVCEAGIDMWPNEYHEEWNDACENRAAAIRARGMK